MNRAGAGSISKLTRLFIYINNVGTAEIPNVRLSNGKTFSKR